MKKYFHITLALFCGIFLSGVIWNGNLTGNPFTTPAYAQCGMPECDCGGWPSCPNPSSGSCACQFVTGICEVLPEYHQDTRNFFDFELSETERWIMEDWIAGYLLPSMMAMTEELTAVAMHQVTIIGSFFDAKLEMETQRILQEIQMQAHKDYHPSEGVCVFATNVRGLAMTDNRVDLTHSIVSTRALNRHLGIENDAGALGSRTDLGEDYTSPISQQRYRSSRLQQFQDEYCRPIDNNNTILFLCGNLGRGAQDPKRYNQDINFLDLFASQKTLSIDFLKTDDERTEDEKNILYDYIAFSKNLYGHHVPYRIPPASLAYLEEQIALIPEGAQMDSKATRAFQNFLNYRSTQAKRSVAENSFHAQTALKAQGDASSALYMEAILAELGMEGTEVEDMLKAGPSHYAQMEILTKKLYQNPQFYVNLYDKPVNVKRKRVAMKAIGLMQNWDIFEANLRVEMLAATLLELGLISTGEEVQGE